MIYGGKRLAPQRRLRRLYLPAHLRLPALVHIVRKLAK